MTRPKVAVLALGGTIAMVPGARGVRPGLGADDLAAAVPGLDALAELRPETVSTLGSYDLTLSAMLDVVRRIGDLQGTVDGVVITQGTDTIEETAFLLDCLIDTEIPIVVTGAMRNPQQVSHDGPGNLLAAVRVATASAIRSDIGSFGVLAVMNDAVHAAATVVKSNSHRIDAFESPQSGPVAVLIEDRVVITGLPVRKFQVPLRPLLAGRIPADIQENLKSVALQTIALDETGGFLDALAAADDHLGYDGLVLALMGGGHLPSRLVDAAGRLAEVMPVVGAGRMGYGPLLAKTYEGPGTEMDLAARGILSAGWLHPLKARILIALLLSCGLGRAEIATVLQEFH